MTNINCSKNCVYQQDGKCGYDNIMLQKTQINGGNAAGCAYQVTDNSQTNQTDKMS